MQEAHCLHSGLSCIFSIIASIKEKEKYLCRVTEASRVVIFIAYICSTLLALSLNYYGPFAFFSQSLLLRRPVEMTVLQTRRRVVVSTLNLCMRMKKVGILREMKTCVEISHPAHRYYCFDSHEKVANRGC